MGFIAGLGAKLAGRALRWATKGRLIGSGGGRQILKRAGQAVGAVAGTIVVQQAAGPAIDAARRAGQRWSNRGSTTVEPWEAGGHAGGFGRSYRRMNPMNVRALRKAVRRVNSAEKLFRQVFTITKGQVNVRKPRRGH